MRIITGKYKGRHFDIPRSFKARPTTDFAKENIFNVLNGYLDFDGATALDLFSGTGSISLEMLSRGCRQVVSVEQDRDHHAFIAQCLKKLNTQDCLPIRGDVFRFLKSCKQQFDFRETTAEARGHLRLRARQELRLLPASALRGTPGLWQCQLLAVHSNGASSRVSDSHNLTMNFGFIRSGRSANDTACH